MTLDELYDRLAALRAEGYGRSKVMVEADQANGAPFLRREIDDVEAIRGELVLLSDGWDDRSLVYGSDADMSLKEAVEADQAALEEEAP